MLDVYFSWWNEGHQSCDIELKLPRQGPAEGTTPQYRKRPLPLGARRRCSTEQWRQLHAPARGGLRGNSDKVSQASLWLLLQSFVALAPLFLRGHHHHLEQRGKGVPKLDHWPALSVPRMRCGG